MTAAAAAAAAVDRDRLVRTFVELVAIDSPTVREQQIGDELERRFAACDASMRAARKAM